LWRARLSNDSEPLRRGNLARVTGANGHLLEVEPAESSVSDS
jgi:hypothetical protein